jgi:hypothetical protein
MIFSDQNFVYDFLFTRVLAFSYVSSVWICVHTCSLFRIQLRKETRIINSKIVVLLTPLHLWSRPQPSISLSCECLMHSAVAELDRLASMKWFVIAQPVRVLELFSSPTCLWRIHRGLRPQAKWWSKCSVEVWNIWSFTTTFLYALMLFFVTGIISAVIIDHHHRLFMSRDLRTRAYVHFFLHIHLPYDLFVQGSQIRIVYELCISLYLLHF